MNCEICGLGPEDCDCYAQAEYDLRKMRAEYATRNPIACRVCAGRGEVAGKNCEGDGTFDEPQYQCHVCKSHDDNCGHCYPDDGVSAENADDLYEQRVRAAIESREYDG